MTPRQFQRLKQRFRAGGGAALRHAGRGRPSPRRLAVQVCGQVVRTDRHWTLAEQLAGVQTPTHLTRMAARDNTVRLGPRWVQISRGD